jgi:hypothetical protein
MEEGVSLPQVKLVPAGRIMICQDNFQILLTVCCWNVPFNLMVCSMNFHLHGSSVVGCTFWLIATALTYLRLI